MNHTKKPSPDDGEGVNRQVDGRGKCEQTQKNDSNLCTPTRPYRLAGSALPSAFGGSERLRKKEKIVFLFINTLLTITYAGFFAKSQIMFFLPSSFRFCLPLKNDGRGVLFCHDILILNEYIKK